MEYIQTKYGTSSDKVGDFTNLYGTNVNNIFDRIPDEAVLRELRPVEGGCTEGFEIKGISDGKTYRVRVHNDDPSAPIGSNAVNGWVVRVQQGRKQKREAQALLFSILKIVWLTPRVK